MLLPRHPRTWSGISPTLLLKKVSAILQLFPLHLVILSQWSAESTWLSILREAQYYSASIALRNTSPSSSPDLIRDLPHSIFVPLTFQKLFRKKINYFRNRPTISSISLLFLTLIYKFIPLIHIQRTAYCLHWKPSLLYLRHITAPISCLIKNSPTLFVPY
jgi:hypothetical protein